MKSQYLICLSSIGGLVYIKNFIDLQNTVFASNSEASLFKSVLWIDTDKLVLVGTKNNRVNPTVSTDYDTGMGAVCLNASDGSIIWNIGIDDDPPTAGLVCTYNAGIMRTSNNLQYILVPIYQWISSYKCSYTGFILLDLSTGSKIKSATIVPVVAGKYNCLGVIQIGDYVYILIKSGQLIKYKYNDSTCTILSMNFDINETGRAIYGDKLVSCNGYLFISDDSTIYKINPDTLKTIEIKHTGCKIAGMCVYDNLIYIRTLENLILVFDHNFELYNVLIIDDSFSPFKMSTINGRLVITNVHSGTDFNILSIDTNYINDIRNVELLDKSIKVVGKRNTERYKFTDVPITQFSSKSYSLINTSTTIATPYTVTDVPLDKIPIIHNIEF